MKRQLCIGLLLVGSAAFGKSIVSAQTVPLRSNLSAGLSWKFTYANDSDSNNTATMGGQSQQFASKTKQRRSGTAEVLAVNNGVPSSMRVTFDQASTNSQEMGGQTQQMPFPLAGQTVTLARQADGTVKLEGPGQIDPSIASEVTALLDRDAVIMPGKPVAVGDEWSADNATAGRVLQLVGQDTGGITLKLLAVNTVDGKQMADVKVSLAIVKNVNGMNAKMTAQGVDTVDLATGHVVKSDLKGTAEVNGQQQMPGEDGQQQAVTLKGTGTIIISGTSPLTAGGPVASPSLSPSPAPAPAPVVPGTATSFAGNYTDGKLKVELVATGGNMFGGGERPGRYQGVFNLNGSDYPATATADGNKLSGTFNAGATAYPFTATLAGDTLTLTTGSTTYQLKKPINPLDSGSAAPVSGGGAPVNPLAP